MRAIRLTDLGEELHGEELLAATAMALEELCIAQALAIIHGRDRAAQMYVERGGHVRFNKENEPVLLWRREFMEL